MGKLHKLTATAVDKRIKPGCYADGGGLYFDVKHRDSRSWVYRYRNSERKDRWMGLGGYPAVTLAAARQKALECTRQRDMGVDPIEHRDALEAATRAAAANRRTFSQCLDEYIAAGLIACSNKKAADQWPSTINRYCAAFLPKFVDAIATADVHAALEPIWSTKNATATRLRGRVEAIFDYAAAKGYRPKGNNPAQWKANLKPLLKQRSHAEPQKHHKSLAYREVGAFMSALRGQEGTSARALELIILTAVRTSEALKATWDEFDLTKRTWTIPARRMKGRLEHQVPLSDAVMTLLEAMMERRESQYVFPGQRVGRPLSDMACLMVLDRMKMRDRIVVHGFRSSFRNWAEDQLEKYPHADKLAERALAHKIKGKVEASYNSNYLLELRRPLMEDWAVYCGNPEPKSATILPFPLAA